MGFIEFLIAFALLLLVAFAGAVIGAFLHSTQLGCVLSTICVVALAVLFALANMRTSRSNSESRDDDPDSPDENSV